MRTLRARVTAAAVVAAAVGLGLGAWAFAWATERALSDRLDSEMTAEATSLVAQADDVAAVRRLVEATPPDRVVQVRGLDGEVLAASRHHVRQSEDLTEIDIVSETDGSAPEAGGGSASPAWVTGTSDLRGLDDGWHVVTAAGDGGQAVVAAPLADLRATVGTVSGLAGVSIPVLVALTGVLVWLALGRALRPIEHARQRAQAAVSVYPPPQLEPGGGGAEVESLLATLDDLLSRAGASHRRQRRFLADAAHELLSPLASLRANLQVALRRGDAAVTARSLERCLESEARLEALAQQLLTLARQEEPDEPRSRDVDLAAVTRDVAREVAAVTEGATSAVAIDLNLDADLVVTGDPVGLRQAVDNLVRNAVSHASSHVAVTSETQSGSVCLLVDDDGSGIPPSHRRTVFEPFVRLDGARDRSRGGAGLGLAIVEAVADRHGGAVRAEDSPLGGARLRLTVPRRATALTAEDGVAGSSD